MSSEDKSKRKISSKKDYEILDDEYSNHNLSFKIIIIGNSGVGKSCLSLRGTKNFFRNDYLSTISFDYFKFNIKLFEKEIKYNKDKDNEDDKDYKIIRLHIWDTCGQEVYRSLVTNYYKNSSLAILVYAIDE